ncbi:hypothetical protein E5983_08710 [Streptococcus danieliae]|uniref:NACHT domain-containing protein n=1 Tax=Streptococcus danieliae TaxID=747656 RepID=A0A7X3GBE2_9STRE|nr:hypothetical protein [Streptococcus danieliae]MVX59704.1 hypothetical protein [Streptococcus danieliae]
MKVILSLIENLLTEKLGNYFSGFLGRIKLRCFVKRLKDEVETSILKQYGDKPYYSDFSLFLIEEGVLNNVIKNFLNPNVLQSKSINQTVDYYIKLFIEKYPRYILFASELKKIIQKYCEILFIQLNKIGTPESQAICWTIKEIIDGVDVQLQHITKSFDNVAESFDNTNALLNKSINGDFRIDFYINTMLETSGQSLMQSDYFERCLFQDTEYNKERNSLDTLLEYRKVVLKGDAGFGKTFETFKLINQLCKEYSKYKLIPVYIPLMEYGVCQEFCVNSKAEFECVY